VSDEPQASDAEVKVEPATEPAATTEEAKAEAKATPEREDNGKFRKPVQPRIDELTRKARENEREAAYWRQRAEAKEAKDAEAAKPVKPTIDQYTDYNEYVEALAEFKAGEKIDARLKARDTESEAKAKATAFATSWNERVADAKAKHEDYESVVSTSDVAVADHVKDVINDSEVGPAVIYHLAKNPDVAQRLNQMTPLGAAREIGRIESQLARTPEPEAETEKTEPSVAPARSKTSTAPAPAKPISSGRATPPDLAKASMDEYVKARKNMGARWAR
jgi:hypothetical protein